MLSRCAQLKQRYLLGTINCEQKIANTHPNKHTHPHTHMQTSVLDDYNKLSLWLSLKSEKYIYLFMLSGKVSTHRSLGSFLG